MDDQNIIRASELSGRAVVDLDSAEKVGTVDRIALDPDARRVAGLFVSRGASLGGEPMLMTVPASAVHAVGPDAVTIHHRPDVPERMVDELRALPQAGDLIGRKAVSEDGHLLGRIGDVLIDRYTGAILAYPLVQDSALGKLEGLFRNRDHYTGYLRADAELRAGDDLVVVPADAMTNEAPDLPPAATSPETDGHNQSRWRECPPSGSGSKWLRDGTRQNEEVRRQPPRLS